MSDIDELIETARRMEPELWAKVDRIALIIDPSAFSEWWDGTGAKAVKREPGIRQKYMQSSARQKAWTILQALGLAPETFDWLALLTTHDERATP